MRYALRQYTLLCRNVRLQPENCRYYNRKKDEEQTEVDEEQRQLGAVQFLTHKLVRAARMRYALRQYTLLCRSCVVLVTKTALPISRSLRFSTAAILIQCRLLLARLATVAVILNVTIATGVVLQLHQVSNVDFVPSVEVHCIMMQVELAPVGVPALVLPVRNAE